jgi:hypothetical protein
MLPIKPAFAAPRWLVFFAYCPSGALTASQRFSLQQLRDLGLPLLVVAATREASAVPLELKDLGHALYWKSLSGYDFSAYTIALEAIADESPGATVFVLNDSVFGPFIDIRSDAFYSPWDMTGWTACGKIENHMQSYAFSIKNLTIARLERLRTVFFRHFSLADPLGVILCQETRLARVATRSMSVGALWCPNNPMMDAPIEAPFTLLRENFPFLKKSLLGKYRSFQEADETLNWLDHFRHPPCEFGDSLLNRHVNPG